MKEILKYLEPEHQHLFLQRFFATFLPELSGTALQLTIQEMMDEANRNR